MYTMGIDIGSTTCKCVIMQDGNTIIAEALKAGGIGTPSPKAVVEEALSSVNLKREDIASIAATGYGRNRCDIADYQISELSCHAMGAHYIFPEARTIIDIGGQDAKVISLNSNGQMQSFLMNDKCAAGTGRFLDVMSAILQVPVNEFGNYAAEAKNPSSISNTCTVFAESEVISQLANGVEMSDLIAGICLSVAGRVGALAKRTPLDEKICMSGGVSKNSGVRLGLEKAINKPILFSSKSQLFGAIGAALSAYKKANS